MGANRQWTDAERRVWNRAIHQEGPDLREGDHALGVLLHVDGYIQNGGVGHAFDLQPYQLVEGLKGYEYFGLHEMAEVIKPHHGEEETDYNSRYFRSLAERTRSRVFLVPEELTSVVAARDEAQAEAVKEKWAATEEFAGEGWQFEDVEEYLQSPIAHAREAQRSRKPLLLWMSL